MTRFISILSGKGGVGKTTISLNLSAALKKQGKDTIVLDADITTPGIGLCLGIAKFDSNLNHFFKGEKDIAELIYLHPQGFKVIPADIDSSRLKKTEINFKRLFKKLRGLSEIVVIDCPSGLGENVRHLIELSDEAIVVTNPDLISAVNALKAINEVEKNGSTLLGVMVNRTGADENEMSIEEIESFLQFPVIAEIPEDKNIPKLFIGKTHNRTNSNFELLAEKLV